jgi:hypothetical protein
VTEAPRGSQSAVTQISEDQFAITFRGNVRMNRRSVAERAMLRAAEAALEKGYEWFFVTETLTQRVNLANVEPLANLDRTPGSVNDTSRGAGFDGAGARGGGHDVTSGVDPGAVGVGTNADPRLLEQSRSRLAYQTVLLIRAGRGRQVAVENASSPPEIFDAASVAQSLRGQLE